MGVAIHRFRQTLLRYIGISIRDLFGVIQNGRIEVQAPLYSPCLRCGKHTNLEHPAYSPLKASRRQGHSRNGQPIGLDMTLTPFLTFCMALRVS